MLFTCSSNGQGRSNGFVIRIVLHILALLKTILFIIMSVSEYGNGVLGVLLNARLTMTDHVSQVLNTCASSMFALRFLRTHGLQPQEPPLVARATTVASILYATPALWGFAGEGDRVRLERLIARMRRRGYLPDDFPKINL